MAPVTQVRVALTVEDFGQVLAFIATCPGCGRWPAGVRQPGGSSLWMRRATLELFDQAQAEPVDAIEAGRRVSGTVRFAVRVADSQDLAARLAAAGAEPVAPPVTTPWGDRNARCRHQTGCS